MLTVKGVVHSTSARKAFADSCRSGDVGLRHHDNKFVATIAGQDVNGAQSAQEHVFQVTQHLVAVLMPTLVVQVFEVVDINDCQREGVP